MVTKPLMAVLAACLLVGKALGTASVGACRQCCGSVPSALPQPEPSPTPGVDNQYSPSYHR